MPRTATATMLAALALSAGAALPSGAAADATGGTAAPDGGSGTGGASSPGFSTLNGALQTGRAALLGRWQRVIGAVEGAAPGRMVLLQRSDGRTGWVTVARVAAGRAGAFALRWRPDRVGRFTLRAVPAAGTAAAAATALPTAATTVYGASMATQYTQYGSRSACGVVLRPTTIGVAHRTLPCGTLVELYYRGRTIKAAVIDRGPYANGAEWDLSGATATALRFNGKDYVGAIRVGRVRLARG